jgi:uncharacterized repeat protein (TIGR03803 family)
MKKINLSAACLLLYLATASAARAQIFTTLAYFNKQTGFPPSGLVQGIDGSFYGTTERGTVFKLIPSRAPMTLHTFNISDSASPVGPLVQGGDGSFYGNTIGGGTNNDGTVFKITPRGAFTTLHDFNGTDGSDPVAGLIQATDGNFYGTTEFGGANSGGTAFQITPSGTLTTIYNFCSLPDCVDGARPEAPLMQGTDGNLYGTAVDGGANNSGTAFQLTPRGVLTTLYSFCAQPNCTDGDGLFYGLTQGSDGNFYGTTLVGGTNCQDDLSCGTIFKLTPQGVLTTLHSFTFDEGAGPSGLIQATDGSFYGTTEFDGINGGGTVFQFNPSGTLTTVYTFGPLGGIAPEWGVIQGVDGKLYGPTEDGGRHRFGEGTIFSVDMGLPPFAKIIPTFGSVGAFVKILGSNFTSASVVTFNGTSATIFKLVSSTQLVVNVPSGATSGTVQVTMSSGTLSSNTPFTVLQ